MKTLYKIWIVPCNIIMDSVYLVFVSSSWHRAPKAIEISWVIVVSFVIPKEPPLSTPEFQLIRWLRVWSLDSCRMGLVTSKTKVGPVSCLCGFHPLTSGKESGACSRRLSSIKTAEHCDLMNFQGDEYVELLGGWYTWTGHGSWALCIYSIWLLLSYSLSN